MEKYLSEDLVSAIIHCTSDISESVRTGVFQLDAQVRAYDLLDRLLGYEGDIAACAGPGFAEACAGYVSAYSASAPVLDGLYDRKRLREELEARLAPLQRKLNDLRFEAASAASLHEFAKEVFEIWQTSGIFARRRALRELRERAGFRLESHRLGNYVSKTFDLMNEAQTRFAHAQQALFAADAAYKIQPGIYGRINEILSACAATTDADTVKLSMS